MVQKLFGEIKAFKNGGFWYMTSGLIFGMGELT